MSNLATQARALAVAARQAVPTAVTVRLEASDQGRFLTASSPFIIDADGNEYDDDDAALKGISDDVWNRACDISWSDAERGEGWDLPGWTIVDARGGYYEIDVATILTYKPDYRESLLFETISEFQRLIDVIPAEPPIIMAEVDDDEAEHPHIVSMTIHCPRCGSDEVSEMDWDTRWNRIDDLGFGEGFDNQNRLFAGVNQADSNFATLCYFCENCGQVLDVNDAEADIEVVWG